MQSDMKHAEYTRTTSVVPTEKNNYTQLSNPNSNTSSREQGKRRTALFKIKCSQYSIAHMLLCNTYCIFEKYWIEYDTL